MAYTAPTPAELKVMYPAFAAVDDERMQLFIIRANRMVDTSWTEGDYADAIMLLACHYMTLAGLGTGAEAEVNANGMAGFKSIRSGQLTLDRGAGNGTGGDVPDEWSGSTYGKQFWWLLKRNRPAVAVAGGAIVDRGWNPVMPYPAAWYR